LWVLQAMCIAVSCSFDKLHCCYVCYICVTMCWLL
jgi:hypothetical protein